MTNTESSLFPIADVSIIYLDVIITILVTDAFLPQLLVVTIRHAHPILFVHVHIPLSNTWINDDSFLQLAYPTTLHIALITRDLP